MQRSIISPVLVLVLASTIGCAGGDSNGTGGLVVENPFEASAQDDSIPVGFEIDGTFGVADAPEMAILGSASSPTVDELGNVYVLDRGNRIVSFDPEGNLRWEMARQGEGPGELNRPWGMEMGPDGLLYVNNQSATRIDIYSRNGEHVRAISPEAFGYQRLQLIGFPNDSTAVGTVFEPGTIGTRIVVLNTGDEWSQKNEIVVDQAAELDVPEGLSGSPGVDVYHGQLAISNVMRYELTLMSLAGDTLRIIRRDVPDYTRPGFHSSGNSISMRFFSSTSAPVDLPTGHRMVQARWPTNVDDPDAYTAAAMNDNAPDVEYHRTLDLYDENWNLLYSISGDEYDELDLGSPEFVDDDGYLFVSRSTPWPRLDRLAVFSTGN